jgi:saccharopine dehydrogenase-like NADP-dependent oxidoreductase
VVAAGKQGALYKQDNTIVDLPYERVFENTPTVSILNTENLAWYPNRNSIPYISLYQIEEAHTFIRTTLRHVDFINGWKKLIKLGLTLDYPVNTYSTQNPAEIIGQILSANGKQEIFQNWFQTDPLFAAQIKALGLLDGSNSLKKMLYSPATLLQELLEQKLKMNDGDQDRIIMQHEIIFTQNEKIFKLISALVLDGKNATETAMAKTVGLPLAISATLFLENKINLTGLYRPVVPIFYQLILPALEKEGIFFEEKVTPLLTL